MAFTSHISRAVFGSIACRGAGSPFTGLCSNFRNFQTTNDESEELVEPKVAVSHHVHKVCLLGELKYEPQTIMSEGEVCGYRFIIQTQTRRKTRENVQYTKNLLHSVTCFTPYMFPILNDMMVNDTVMVDGNIDYFSKSEFGQTNYKMIVRATNIVPISKSS